ncbi:hypothetical protein DYB36_002809 [Aphanomyces astaci]|uniref:MutL C-terminal dimerisation domain-containing protein n=1 Tax=Aphanomyces astaci TaxID=112090 RepID=A0A396ZTK8_APHAT|nr:hypothetical protein DYB36_002809 [Aphanomyces astaci]
MEPPTNHVQESTVNSFRLGASFDPRQQLASLGGAECPSYQVSRLRNHMWNERRHIIFQAVAFASAPTSRPCFRIDGVIATNPPTFSAWSTANVARAMLSYQSISFNNLWIDGFYTQCTLLLRQHILQHKTDIPMVIINVQCSPEEFTLVNEDPGVRAVQFRHQVAFEDFFRAFLEVLSIHVFCHHTLPRLPLVSDNDSNEATLSDGDSSIHSRSLTNDEHDTVVGFKRRRRERMVETSPLGQNRIAFNEFSNAIWTSMPNRMASPVRQTCLGRTIADDSAPAGRSLHATFDTVSKYFKTGNTTATSQQKPWDHRPMSYTNPLSKLHPWMKQRLSVLVQNARTIQSVAIQLPASMLQHLDVLQQVDNKFILVQCKAPLLLLCIDQHAADERVKLEALENSHLSAAFPSRSLDKSHVLELNDIEKQVVRCHGDSIRHWGFEVVEDGDVDKWSLARVPVVDHREATCDDFFEYLHLLATMAAPTLPRPPAITRFLHSRACRSAIMFGDPLTREECQTLIRQLSTCRLPFQCAHGRPSIVPLVQLTESD